MIHTHEVPSSTLGLATKEKGPACGPFFLPDGNFVSVVSVVSLCFIPMKLAVVDIEPTGLYHQGHGITEVAVVHLDAGGMPVPSFHSLVNPYRVVPSAVEALTGISTGLVEHAPDFSEVVEPLTEALEGRIFVAHNVNFDYRFLESAYSEQNRTLRAKRLCTMRYARKILP